MASSGKYAYSPLTTHDAQPEDETELTEEYAAEATETSPGDTLLLKYSAPCASLTKWTIKYPAFSLSYYIADCDGVEVLRFKTPVWSSHFRIEEAKYKQAIYSFKTSFFSRSADIMHRDNIEPVAHLKSKSTFSCTYYLETPEGKYEIVTKGIFKVQLIAYMDKKIVATCANHFSNSSVEVCAGHNATLLLLAFCYLNYLSNTAQASAS